MDDRDAEIGSFGSGFYGGNFYEYFCFDVMKYISYLKKKEQRRERYAEK